MKDMRKFYINGEWVDPINGTDFPVINPSTEEAYATISLGGKEDAESAIAAAKAAFPSWSKSSKAERIELMETILEVYMKRSDEMGETISEEMGAPVSMSKTSQSGTGSYHIKAFIDAMKTYEFERELRPDTPNDRIHPSSLHYPQFSSQKSCTKLVSLQVFTTWSMAMAQV